MNREKLLKKALLEYEELKKYIKNYKGNFENLCEELGGFNITKEYFDINYKSLTTTIYYEDNKIIVSDFIDIWNDLECEPIESEFDTKKYKGGL